MKTHETGQGRFRSAAPAFALLGVLLASPARGQDWKATFDATGNFAAQTTESTSLPQIVSQPLVQIVAPGELASFFVVVADTRGLSCQWRFNGTNLSAATSDTLLLTNVSFTNEGPYSVVLANSSGSVTSSVAQLYIDSRGVGMPDSWQLAYFGNLNQNPTADFDGDGVNNLQEFLDGTNPTNALSALYRITLFNDGGTVVAVPDQPSYTNGQVVTLTATGSGAALFHAWTGDVVTRSNTVTVTMSTNRSLFARFQPFALNWTNTVSGDWSVASNWFPNLVPGSNESVVIVNQALTVTLNGDADLLDLTLGGNSFSGPELKVAGRLTIAGMGTWEGGTMSGPGATVVLPGASFTIISFTTPTLNGRTLENAGTMSWMGGSLFMIGGVITNDAGAQFAVEGPGTFAAGGGTPRFDNAGTLVTAANGTTALGVAFNNYGTVNIQGGTFSMSGGGVQAGNMPVPAGTAVNFAGGTFISSDSLSIAGAGTLLVSGGTLTLGGTVNVTGSNIFSSGSVDFTGNYTCVGNTVLDISGGTVSFDGTGVVAPNTLNLNGSLGGADTVTVGSAMNWTGGSMNGTGKTIIQPGATLTIAGFTGYGGVYLYDRTLENAGTVVWGGGNLGLSGVITNDAGASFQLLNAAMFNIQGNTPRFDNAGTFLPSSTGTTAFNGILFDNYGAINLTGASVLYLNGGGTNSGPITVPAGATINFGGGVFNASAGSSVTGAGSLQVSGGTANLAGTVNVSATNSFSNGTANLTGNYTCVGDTLLDISGGTVSFNGSGTVSPNHVNLNGALGGAQNVTVGSVMNWTGGSMNGSGQTIIRPGATLTVNNPSFMSIASRTLDNGGTTFWSVPNLSFNGGVITNEPGALFQAQSPSAFNIGGGSPRFDNGGTFRAMGAGTTSLSGVAMNNFNLVDIQGGTLALSGGGSHAGIITVPAGTTLDFGGGVFTSTANSSITGAGTLMVDFGQGTLGGTINVTGSNVFNNGSIDFTGNYICTNNTMVISGSTMSFDGTGKVAPTVLNLNGTLGGAQDVTVTSAMSWTGGSMNGNGRTIIPPGATLTIANPAFMTINNRTLDNGGTTLWTGAGTIRATDAVITNRVGALFNAQNASPIFFGGGAPRFDNAGTFRKSTNTGTTTIGISFANYGTIDIQTGFLAASGGYGSSSNSVLNCALAGTAPGTNYGQLQVSGAVTLNGTVSVNLAKNYAPATNDSFTLMAAGTLNGTFANFIYPSNQVAMVLSNTPTSVIATVTGVNPVRLAPILRLDRISSNSGRLYWSTNYPDYHLEYNATLRSTNWAASGLAPVITGTNLVVTNALSGLLKFYRLSSLSPPYAPPPPALKLQLVSAGKVQLLWPIDNDRPFLLQTTTNLSSANWTSVLPSPSVLGSNNVVTNASSGSRQFYRLSSQ